MYIKITLPLIIYMPLVYTYIYIYILHDIII